MSRNTNEATAKQKEAMINALETNYERIQLSADQAGISVRTHYRWLKEDEDYEYEVVNIKDITNKKLKDSLLDKALKLIDSGNTTVLNQLLRIYFKNLPEEMKTISNENDNQKWDMRIDEDEEEEEYDEEEYEEEGEGTV